VDDFVPHRIQHQVDGGMKPELKHDVAAMGFCRLQRNAERGGYVLRSLTLTHELHDLSLSERQSRWEGHGWSNAMALQIAV